MFYYDDFSDLEKTSFSFAEQDYEDTILPALQEINPDKALVIESIKTIYDWSILSDILGNSKYLSDAKVEQYEKHARELRIIRRLIKTYCSRDEYNKFFNGTDKGAGYSNYIGEIQKNGKKYPAKKCTEEEFYKRFYVVTCHDENDQEYHIMVDAVDGGISVLDNEYQLALEEDLPEEIPQIETKGVSSHE